MSNKKQDGGTPPTPQTRAGVPDGAPSGYTEKKGKGKEDKVIFYPSFTYNEHELPTKTLKDLIDHYNGLIEYMNSKLHMQKLINVFDTVGTSEDNLEPLGKCDAHFRDYPSWHKKTDTCINWIEVINHDKSYAKWKANIPAPLGKCDYAGDVHRGLHIKGEACIDFTPADHGGSESKYICADWGTDPPFSNIVTAGPDGEIVRHPVSMHPDMTPHTVFLSQKDFDAYCDITVEYRERLTKHTGSRGGGKNEMNRLFAAKYGVATIRGTMSPPFCKGTCFYPGHTAEPHSQTSECTNFKADAPNALTNLEIGKVPEPLPAKVRLAGKYCVCVVSSGKRISTVIGKEVCKDCGKVVLDGEDD